MLVALLSLLAVVQSPEPAISAPEASQFTDSAEVVVRGERGQGGPDAGNRPPKVIVGSRIPRRSLQTNPYIASATSLGGLNSGSGMDPFSGDTNLRWKSCKVPGYAVGTRYSCQLGKAQRAVDARQWAAARAIASDLAARPDLSIDGRYLAHRTLYTVATATDDAAARQSLTAMIETGVMPPGDTLAAQRTLATMAASAGDAQEVATRYHAIATLDPDDYQVRIDLAVLSRQAGQFDASRRQFREAISIMTRRGLPVPESLVLNAR